MPKVDNCLCLKLETGGKIIAWIGIIGASLFAIFSAFTLYWLSKAACKDSKDLYNRLMNDDKNDVTKYDCHIFETTFAILLVFLLAIEIMQLVFYILLLKGIYDRSYKMIVPALVLEGLGLFLIVLSVVLEFTWTRLIESLIFGFITLYCLIVLYSIYDKFKSEKRRNYVAEFSNVYGA